VILLEGEKNNNKWEIYMRYENDYELRAAVRVAPGTKYEHLS